MRKGCWCQGGHPVIGGRLPLSIPPQAMDQGLFGELSVQFVSLLSPCLLQYPNLPTELTHVQVSFFWFYCNSLWRWRWAMESVLRSGFHIDAGRHEWHFSAALVSKWLPVPCFLFFLVWSEKHWWAWIPLHLRPWPSAREWCIAPLRFNPKRLFLAILVCGHDCRSLTGSAWTELVWETSRLTLLASQMCL